MDGGEVFAEAAGPDVESSGARSAVLRAGRCSRHLEGWRIDIRDVILRQDRYGQSHLGSENPPSRGRPLVAGSVEYRRVVEQDENRGDPTQVAVLGKGRADLARSGNDVRSAGGNPREISPDQPSVEGPERRERRDREEMDEREIDSAPNNVGPRLLSDSRRDLRGDTRAVGRARLANTCASLLRVQPNLRYPRASHVEDNRYDINLSRSPRANR